jgi:hypothetical protein
VLSWGKTAQLLESLELKRSVREELVKKVQASE